MGPPGHDRNKHAILASDCPLCVLVLGAVVAPALSLCSGNGSRPHVNLICCKLYLLWVICFLSCIMWSSSFPVTTSTTALICILLFVASFPFSDPLIKSYVLLSWTADLCWWDNIQMTLHIYHNHDHTSSFQWVWAATSCSIRWQKSHQ